LKPDVNARRFPVVRFVENVGAAVAVEIGNPGFVEVDAGREICLFEFAFAIAIKNPGCGIGIVGRFRVLSPFSHFSGEDVEVAVAVNVSDLKAVAVNHVAIEEIVTAPISRALRIADTFVPTKWADAVTGRYDDLGKFSSFEFSDGNAPADGSNLDGIEIRTTAMLEPDISREQIEFPFAVHINCRHAFGILKSGFAGCACLAEKISVKGQPVAFRASGGISARKIFFAP